MLQWLFGFFCVVNWLHIRIQSIGCASWRRRFGREIYLVYADPVCCYARRPHVGTWLVGVAKVNDVPQLCPHESEQIPTKLMLDDVENNFPIFRECVSGALIQRSLAERLKKPSRRKGASRARKHASGREPEEVENEVDETADLAEFADVWTKKRRNLFDEATKRSA